MPQAATVHRPIVRTFKAKFAKEAAAHARAGGHSVYWETDKRAVLYFPVPTPGDDADFGLWALYDMAKSRWQRNESGAFKGLASTLVPKDCHWIVKDRALRDSVHPGPTREVSWDCQSCAACCRDNEVILQPNDIQRFKDHGLAHIGKPPYARRKDGNLVLTLLDNKRCRHLARDNRCKIYEARPHPCREFPMGTECCMFARGDILGLWDGLPPEHSPS